VKENMKAKIRIAELARQHGFKNAYALQNALKCSPTMAARLWSGEFKQIGIETMDKLCDLFKCSYNDLFGYDVAPVAPVKADKPKQKGVSWVGKMPGGGSLAEILAEGNSGEPFKHSVLDIVQSSSDNEYVLTTKDAGELLNLSPRTVRENAEKGLLHGKQGKQNHWFFRRSDIDNFIAQRGKE
jgi:DNA-binding Xre family transcriptional regulator